MKPVIKPEYVPILEIVPTKCRYINSDSDCAHCPYFVGVDEDNKHILCQYNLDQKH